MKERKHLMHHICMLGFAVDDIILFLDTHPEDEQAFAYYEEVRKEYMACREEYISLYGPLNIREVHSARPCSCNENRYRRATWSWGECPMPWEGGC